MAKPKPRLSKWPTVWRVALAIYALLLVLTDVKATYETAVGYNTYDSCGTVMPARPGVALVTFLLFVPVYVAIVIAYRRPPRRWWSSVLWIVGLAALGVGAELFVVLSNLDLCFTF